jgi:S-formylglutathione hydrolase FrmB
MRIAPKNETTTQLGRFAYARYSYSSIALHADNTFGTLTPVGARAIAGTLYFLHGGDGTDEQWVQAKLEGCVTDAVMSVLADRGIQIVLPNIGLSYLREPDDRALPSHWRALFDELMPHVEANTDTSAARRWMTGISMGGCAALSAFLRRPDMFAGCGTHFPGIVNFDPFSDHALQAYAARTGISDTHRAVLGRCFRDAFTNAEEYSRHDPLALVAAMEGGALVGKRLYMDVGTLDEFGLSAGVMRFAELCAERDIGCHAHVIAAGRHDAAFLHARLNCMLSDVISA